jgi:hypothetical protein
MVTDMSVLVPAAERVQHAYMAHITTSVAADDTRRLVREGYAAQLLAVTPSQMRRWRRAREGPRYRKMSRMVVYQIRDLLEFIESLPAAGGKVA